MSRCLSDLLNPEVPGAAERLLATGKNWPLDVSSPFVNKPIR